MPSYIVSLTPPGPLQRAVFPLRTATRMLTSLPTEQITCKKDATPDQVAAAKEAAKEKGGTIGHEYKLIKGFS